MISIKDKFYKGIGEEYHNRQTESFIYQYLKREKESHIRLHLIQRYHELKEKSMSREEYTAFLIKTLQEDRQISKNRKKISLLPDFLDGMLEVMGEPKRRSYSNSEIKKVLKQGGDHLKRRKKLEIDRKLLSDITREIFECTESGKERKEWYVQLTEGFLCYDLGEISGNQYLKIIIEILLCHGKLHLSKDTRKKITNAVTMKIYLSFPEK